MQDARGREVGMNHRGRSRYAIIATAIAIANVLWTGSASAHYGHLGPHPGPGGLDLASLPAEAWLVALAAVLGLGLFIRRAARRRRRPVAQGRGPWHPYLAVLLA